MSYEPASPFWQAVGYWQTLIAGVLAVFAAGATILATIRAANREIAAAQEQTKAARDQIAATERIELQRILRTSLDFLVVVEAAARRVLEDAPAVRAMVPVPPQCGFRRYRPVILG